MNWRALLLLPCVSFPTTSCQSFGPPPPDLKGLLAESPPVAQRQRARVNIQSELFSGEFQAIAIERRSPEVEVRLQLFPDLGGKLLDMVATPGGVTAVWSHNGEVVREREGFIGFLAVSLIENATPLAWQRIRGSRPLDGGWRLDVDPGSHDLDLRVEVDLSPEGKLLARHYWLGVVGWVERFEPQHEIQSRNFSWTFLEETCSQIDLPADELFQLNLPEEELEN